MARIRQIKPEFFIDDDIAQLHPLTRLLFIGLWAIADKEGRLDDKPARIKCQVQPYDNTNTDKQLQDLADHGFIIRYAVNGRRYIQIRTFAEHQNPHIREAESTIPPPNQTENQEHQPSTVQAPDLHHTCTGKALAEPGGIRNTEYGIRNTEYGIRNTDTCADVPPAIVSPKKPKQEIQEPEIPENLNTDSFTATYAEFLEHRRIKNKGREISTLSKKGILEKLGKYSEPIAIQALKDAIIGNWSGVFPDGVRVGNGNGSRGSPPMNAAHEVMREIFDKRREEGDEKSN